VSAPGEDAVDRIGQRRVEIRPGRRRGQRERVVLHVHEELHGLVERGSTGS
jgi:hypothetical protein